MKVLAIIVVIVYALLLGLNVYNERTKTAYGNHLQKTIERLNSLKTWEYYVYVGAAWAVDLLILICLIAACVVL